MIKANLSIKLTAAIIFKAHTWYVQSKCIC